MAKFQTTTTCGWKVSLPAGSTGRDKSRRYTARVRMMRGKGICQSKDISQFVASLLKVWHGRKRLIHLGG